MAEPEFPVFASLAPRYLKSKLPVHILCILNAIPVDAQLQNLDQEKWKSYSNDSLANDSSFGALDGMLIVF